MQNKIEHNCIYFIQNEFISWSTIYTNKRKKYEKAISILPLVISKCIVYSLLH